METKPFLYRFFGHFKTITTHKLLVQYLCIRCGLYKQGVLHDLSKYSLSEFVPGVKYYCGYKSPIAKEKECEGISSAYLHHKGRNKHHWEYWIDIKISQKMLQANPMPFNYVIECVLDKICASKVYKKNNFTIEYPYDYFVHSIEYEVMNPKTAKQIATLLLYLKENGEKKAYAYYAKLYKNYKKDKNFTI